MISIQYNAARQAVGEPQVALFALVRKRPAPLSKFRRTVAPQISSYAHVRKATVKRLPGGEERKEASLPVTTLAAAKSEPEPAPTPDWEEIFRAKSQRVFRTAYRVTGSAADAEDVLQTVFLRLMRRDEADTPVENIDSYLHRAAVNAALDLVRLRRTWQSVPLEDTVQFRTQDPSSDPDRSHRSAELRGLLRKAVAGLAGQAAEIFTLRHIEGVENIEIARMLGVSQTQVAVSLHRTRSRLQKEVQAWLGGKL
jgi:RNA polymerase sigma-70 factor, ECF subfamily